MKLLEPPNLLTLYPNDLNLEVYARLARGYYGYEKGGVALSIDFFPMYCRIEKFMTCL